MISISAFKNVSCQYLISFCKLNCTFAGPTSPHTPSALPDIYIQDWSHDCDKGLAGLDADFAVLRENLEPIDDQLLATLSSSGTFVDPAVEEQFKMNYTTN